MAKAKKEHQESKETRSDEAPDEEVLGTLSVQDEASSIGSNGWWALKAASRLFWVLPFRSVQIRAY